MSPEMETLDQGGDLALSVVRELYPDDAAFRQAVVSLLTAGDIRLLASHGIEVPSWKWRDIFSTLSAGSEFGHLKVRITKQGVRRIK